jgi:diguanylate cyclase (GGDEF)-like protein/PAS domain S-box-containing protein
VPRNEPGKPAGFAFGALFALLGVAIVEGLIFAGYRPFGPLGWPGLAFLAAIALAGIPGLAGGMLVLVLYYAINFANQQRFPEFFAGAGNTVSWLVGLSLLAIAVLSVRPRLLRAALAEAELAALRRYEQALRESEERLRMVTENVPGLVAYIDKEERYRFANRTYETWFGLPPEKVIGRHVRTVWGDERYPVLKPNIERALRGERVTYDYAVPGSGGERHVLASYVPDPDAHGAVKGFFVLGSDITELAATRNALHTERARLEAALDGSSVALWDTDLRTGRVYLSDAWAEITGAPAGETVTTLPELMALMHAEDLEEAKRLSVQVLKGHWSSYALEHRVRARSGEWKWVLSRGRVAERHPASGRAVRMIGTNVDITERRRLEEAMQSAARTDALTGLANRVLFSERLRLAGARSRRSGSGLAVLYVDMDRFKEVNDAMGHAAGDAVLRDFATRLRSTVRATDTVARFGGDEFVILLDEVKAGDSAARVAAKILEDCRHPVRLDGREIPISASIGIAYSDGRIDEGALLKSADAALYEAKQAGRNGFRVAPG